MLERSPTPPQPFEISSLKESTVTTFEELLEPEGISLLHTDPILDLPTDPYEAMSIIRGQAFPGYSSKKIWGMGPEKFSIGNEPHIDDPVRQIHYVGRGCVAAYFLQLRTSTPLRHNTKINPLLPPKSDPRYVCFTLSAGTYIAFNGTATITPHAHYFDNSSYDRLSAVLYTGIR